MYGINYQQSVYMLVIIIITNRRKYRTQKTRWPTKNYLDNGPDKQHWESSITNQKEQLKIEKIAWTGLVVNIAQEMTIRRIRYTY